MYLYSFLALAGIVLARPCDEHSSAGADGTGNQWRAWSQGGSSTSTPVQGDYQAPSTASKGWSPSGSYSPQSAPTSTASNEWSPSRSSYYHQPAPTSASGYSFSVPQAGSSAHVFPLHKRANPNALPVHTPTGWGDWTYPAGSSSSTKSASGSKSTTYVSTTSSAASTTGTSSVTKKTTASATSSTLSTSPTPKGSSASSQTTASSGSSVSSTSKASSASSSSTASTLTSTASSSISSLSSVSSSTSSSLASSSTTSSSTSSAAEASATLLNPERNFRFTVDVTIGDTDYELVVDTGSSDTWAAAGTQPSGFTPIPNEYLYIEYQDNSYALGPLGNDSVTIGGLTVPEQIVSIVDQTNATSNDSVGIIGLSFNDLTSEFIGQEPAAANRPLPYPGPQASYSSIINTIFDVDNLTPHLFSLALSRDTGAGDSPDAYGGVLVIGGQPDLTDPTINVTTPLVSTAMAQFGVEYTIDVGSVTYGSQVLDEGVRYLVDSGTTLVYAPDASVSAYWDQFNPAPDATTGLVDCTAAVPPYGVTIGTQTFFVNPADILIPSTVAGSCFIGIQPGGSGPYILGDVFLLNVLAVFDWSTEQISFGGREYYSVPA